MSKFADKLRRASRSSAPPVGFRPAASESKNPAMLLVASLPSKGAKEAEIMANGVVDAGLIWEQDMSSEQLEQMVKAAGDIPLGMVVSNASKDKLEGLLGLGCDFLVFDIKAPAEALQDEKISKFLLIEPSLDQGMVKAISSFDLDGVLINRKEESFITVEHLLIYQRFSELLNKPLLVTSPSSVTSAELGALQEVGINAIISPRSQPIEALGRVRGIIDNLPKRTKRWHSKANVMLPHHGGSVEIEEEEEEEEEEI